MALIPLPIMKMANMAIFALWHWRRIAESVCGIAINYYLPITDDKGRGATVVPPFVVCAVYYTPFIHYITFSSFPPSQAGAGMTGLIVLQQKQRYGGGD